MLQKMRSRYHKYKGRYADAAKAYTELEVENTKVKNIMQQTQVQRDCDPLAPAGYMVIIFTCS